MNYLAVGWSVRSLDTVLKYDTTKVLARVTKKLLPGDIILLHDKNPNIVEILKGIIKFGMENEFKFVRLDELIQVNAYE
jgi:peptidoglycan-N-acetylglucosamine deacetylase